MKKQTIAGACAALLIFLFLYTAVHKLANFDVFIYNMGKQPLPKWMDTILVYTLPPIEIILAAILFFDKTRLIGFWGSLIIMSLFTLYVISVLLNFYHYIPCACGGVITKLKWNGHLILNLCFVGIAITGILTSSKASSKLLRSRPAYS